MPGSPGYVKPACLGPRVWPACLGLTAANAIRNLEQMQSDEAIPPAPRLLFIVGMWRSGTSLIHALLNRHPQVALMYEAEPLEMWPSRHGKIWSRDWPRRLEFFNQTFTRHKLDEQSFASIPPGREGALALYREYARRRGAIIMGEKAPSYHTRLPMLGRFFPDAQFLIIWRDPMECCRSALRAARTNRFFAQRGMIERMLMGAEALAQGAEQLRHEKRSLCEVVYNQLVENPERELRRVCEFLKIPFAPGMLDLKSADVSSVPTGEHHAGVRSGLIGRATANEEILPSAFVAKAGRYAALWRERYSQSGFARALTASQDAATPGTVERIVDRCTILFRRTLDGMKRCLFRRMPLPWWAWLRSRTPRGKIEEKKFHSAP